MIQHPYFKEITQMSKRFNFLLFIVPLLVFQSSCQKKLHLEDNSSAGVYSEANIDSIAQQIAIFYGDYDKAITFGYRSVAKDPDNLGKLFVLARMHYFASHFEISVKICADILSKDSLSQNAMELAALSFVGLKSYDNAINLYKSTGVKFSNPVFLYKAAVIEFESEKLDECLNTLNAALQDSSITRRKIGITRVNAANQSIVEEINLLAGTYNLAGYVALTKGMLPQAKDYFTKALAIEPSFVLAENNLKEVLKKEGEEKKEGKKEGKKKGEPKGKSSEQGSEGAKSKIKE
jgi:tetratricopeptide (TPR) repeat protein